ncbi:MULTISPECIES: UPF0223 family protein [Aerococcus]|uniref:UPF0223 protein AWM76_07755 n=2 Tax=Aerococcus viridans TaxID=1377 RepID=A0AAU8U5V7_9LACT|nr:MULTISPECIES: UPF0223 family protein [Aerococcus]AMC01453.1 hypothetical protein AWM76_07755 [Aerococcus viridans]EFG50101.1 hypothetical protein HMPREF0061_0554 [Aerococcus viridans ATCC 11563 = CCUG 4311]MEC1386705.1 UPF0223 family protein [Aerococcus viridans]SPT62370.1 Uncharacterised protein family (UPF0223) [Aerococcus viridans]SUU15191.1 Uncharacterised protein family (UPF0223) [Aerococcus viridans]
MSNNYQYPIDLDWTSQEMATVVKMWNGLEQAYESSINREELLNRYKAFKEVVPSKMEEKQLGNSFEKISGYQLYGTIKKARNSEAKTISMP